MSSQPTIRLTNTVSGEKVEFSLSDQATPAVSLKLNKRDKLIERYADLDNSKQPEAADLLHSILEAGVDALCIILHIDKLPEPYTTKRDLISDCMTNMAVVNVIVEVFYKALSASTASLGASDYQKQAVEAVEIIRD